MTATDGALFGALLFLAALMLTAFHRERRRPVRWLWAALGAAFLITACEGTVMGVEFGQWVAYVRANFRDLMGWPW